MLENKINLNLDLNNDQKGTESLFSKNDKPARKKSERKDDVNSNNLIEENKTQLVFAVAVFSHLVMNWLDFKI